MHKQRMTLVFKEMLASILINFGVNLLLLTPLIILGNFNYHCSTIVKAHLQIFFSEVNMWERHDILLNSIGPFPEEFEAMEKIKLIIGLGYSLLVVLTIVQVVSFYLYNKRFHPFAKIVMPDPTSKLFDNF